MYRLFPASKDTYITSKYIQGKRSSVDANVGQAGTIDLYSLFDETTVPGVSSSIREVSRGLIKFDLTKLQALVPSGSTQPYIDITHPSFRCFVQLKDIYGGQTTPSNFSLTLFPMAKKWCEGPGMDVISYQDKGVSNFLSASETIAWAFEGAEAGGVLGAPPNTLDFYSSGDIGNGVISLGRSQSFPRGDEDLFIEVTDLVSASLSFILPDHGYRLSYSDAEEQSDATYFVKRFGTRHTNDKTLHPKMVMKYDDSIIDSSGMPQFNISQSFFLYNRPTLTDELTNLTSGSVVISGSNSLVFELHASKSVSYMTSSWSVSHSASINHLTKSMSYYSQSFPGSQHGNMVGVYSSSFYLDSSVGSPLHDWLSGSEQQKFIGVWKNTDGTQTYGTNWFTFKYPNSSLTNNVSNLANLVVNITNLKNAYLKDETEATRLRVYMQDYNTEQVATKVPVKATPVILTNTKWSIREAFTNKVIIPFGDSTDTATKMSTDAEGMYFDIFMSDFDVEQIYQIDLLLSDNVLVRNDGFRFKVVSYL